MIKFIAYKAGDGFRWRAKVGSKIVADSGEAYKRPSSVIRAIVRFTDLMQPGSCKFVDNTKLALPDNT